jgi:hypothetical protein
LTDNEKTVTVEHVARIAIRNPDMVAAAGHYGLTVATCLPADAPSKGGSEATVRVAKGRSGADRSEPAAGVRGLGGVGGGLRSVL